MTDNTQSQTHPINLKPGVRIKLASLWVTLMLLYIYADFFSLYQPGELKNVLAGMMGPFPVTQTALLMASVMMAIPTLMVFLSISLPHGPCRWANVVLAVLYTMVNGQNLIGETWIYYWLFGVLEIVITLTILVFALKWRLD